MNTLSIPSLTASSATTTLIRLHLLTSVLLAAADRIDHTAADSTAVDINQPTLLFWNAPGWFLVEKTAHDPRCLFTSDRGAFRSAAAVVFYGDDDVSADYPPVSQRPAGQRWVLAEWEPPLNYNQQRFLDHWPSELASAVNSTMTYRRDSDIVAPYGWTVPISMDMPNRLQHLQRPRLAVWVTSHCRTSSKREEYVFELQKHLGGELDIFGKCGKPIECAQWDDVSCASQLYEPYKFVLAFENSKCVDYITEKFWYNGLAMGPVPVVLGANRADVERVAPSGSFLHIDDFASPAALAAYMQELARNPTAYAKFHVWRESAKAAGSEMPGQMQARHWKSLCDHVVEAAQAKQRSQPQAPKKADVISWWRSMPGLTSSACQNSSFAAEVVPWVALFSVALLSAFLAQWNKSQRIRQEPDPSTPLFGSVHAQYTDVLCCQCLLVCAFVALSWSLRVFPFPISVGVLISLPSVMAILSSQCHTPAASIASVFVKLVAMANLIRWTSPTLATALYAILELPFARGWRQVSIACTTCFFAFLGVWAGGAVAVPQSSESISAVLVWVVVHIAVASIERVVDVKAQQHIQPRPIFLLPLLVTVALIILSGSFGLETMWLHAGGFAPWHTDFRAEGIPGTARVALPLLGLGLSGVCVWLASNIKVPGMDVSAWAFAATALSPFNDPLVRLPLTACFLISSMRIALFRERKQCFSRNDRRFSGQLSAPISCQGD